ncbi:MAG: hypothetical protein V3T23_00265 [Nitrososphaerales archaeon]
MAKTGCPVCGKAFGAGHWTISDCPQVRSEIVVERVKQPELPPAPQRTSNIPDVPQHVPLTSDASTTNDGYVPLTSTTNMDEAVPLTRNRKWEASHPEYKDWKRTYQREYMRRRRAG